MKPSVAVPLWDWVLVGTIFLPLLPIGIATSGRLNVAAVYLTVWTVLVVTASVVSHFVRLPFRTYLRDVLRHR